MSTVDVGGVVETARRVAEELLAPQAARVEADGAVPRSHLDALAAAGLGRADGPEALAVLEELAAGDLATAFVWIQRFGVTRWLELAGPPWAAELEDLRAGRLQAGIALQAALRPGPAAVVARREDDGGDFVLDGTVPWVTGWGLLDAVLLTARDGEDVFFLLVHAVESPTLRGEPLDLVGVPASRTVELHLTGHRVPADRLVATGRHAALLAGDAAGLRPNGSLALGLVLRCVRALSGSPAATALQRDLDAARTRLDAAGPGDLPVARAGAVELAWRAAGTLATATGSGAVISGGLAERTVREALFLLVFGSRPAIRADLVGRLSGSAG